MSDCVQMGSIRTMKTPLFEDISKGRICQPRMAYVNKTPDNLRNKFEKSGA
jgi:hypothetical protein